MSEPKLLFILKRMEDYNQNSKSHVGLQTGLYNSASYMNDMLIESGIKTEMVIVNDNNDIDREVHDHKPTHVIIEALWVVPSKFAILCKLHPNVKWIIRLHSEIPFLANEGMALDWIGEYGSFKNIIIASNAPRALKDIRFYLKHKNNWTDDMAEQRVIYLPNFYSQKYIKKTFNKEKDHVDVSCFGAIRPLKNHIIQAIAAIKFGDKIGKKIKFHINSGRIEMKGEAILNNLKSLFLQLHDSGHELVIHEWTPREGFIELCSKMDIGMQVSISETFNIVAADLISQGVPVVGSSEIPWINNIFCGKAVETDEICRALLLTYYFPSFNYLTNQMLLKSYTNKSRKIWKKYFTKK